MSFWGELKRRNVFKVGAAYVIVAWLIVQVANTFFPIFDIPDWAVALVASLLVLGLPVALILAWAYELTPEGVKLTKKVPLAESITQVTGRKLNYVLFGVIVVAAVYILFDKLYLDRRVVQTEAPKTIAVLPFDDLSPEKDQEYFVLGLSEEILNYLSSISDLNVTSKTSAFAFKETNKTIQEIAEILGRDYILEGSVRKAGNELRITAQLIHAVDDRHLWSKTYDKEFKVEEMFSLQEEIATAVANELKLNFGIGSSIKQLGGTDNVEAYELYLAAKGKLYSTISEDDAYRILELIDSSIASDPDFALAWALKAEIYNMFSAFVAPDFVAAMRDTAEQAALRAIDLEPDLAAGYFPLGALKQSKGNWIEAEALFSKGMARTPGSVVPELTGMIQSYWAVGQLTKCHELIEAAKLNDPLNKEIRLGYIWSLGFIGNIQDIEEEYDRCEVLFGRKWAANMVFVSRICAGKVVSIDEITEFAGSDRAWPEAKEHLRSPEESLAWLRQIYDENDGLSSADFCFISLFAAYFRDPEFSMDAMEKGVIIDAQGIFWIWAPVFQEVRQTSRFKQFVREIGLVDYWNEFGYPDLCHPKDDGDFVCD